MSKELNEELYLAPEAEATENSETVSKGEKKKRKKSKRLGEVCELRGENKKVFRMDDGTEQAEFYPNAVHLLDEETGEYVEPDNTLVLEEDGKHYRNGKNRFSAKFNCEEDTNELFSMEKGIYKVTVSAKKSKKQIGSGLSAKLRKDENAKDRIMFEGIDSVSDIEYSVIDNGVKENIIVKEKAPVYHYGFILHCENVAAVFDDEAKQVSFVSNETGEEVFFIPAPFMKDANGEVSHDVSYEVKTVANGDVQLTVTADSEWINAEERALPVTIDPQIMVAESVKVNTYSWCENSLRLTNEPFIGYVRGASSYTAGRTYINMKVPSLSRNPRIKKAEITFTQGYTTAQNSNHPMFGLYRVTENITTGAVTPTHDSELIDYARFKHPSTDDEVVQYTFDVTSLMEKLNKEGATAANLVLKMLDETATSEQYIVLYGISSGANVPKLSITYESSYGVNTSYRTHTHELGRFGQGSIDLACGNLMFNFEDFVWAGTRMPVTIRHLYNSALSDIQYTNNTSAKLTTANFASMKLGYGWKLNLMQSVVACSDGYIYTNENGEQFHFIESEETATDSETSQCYHLFEDESGGGLMYDPVNKTIVLGGEIHHFDDSGRLVSIADEYNQYNHIDITYTSNRISSVTDGAGREFNFTYNSNGQLTSIVAPDDTVISYAYSSNYLSSITYPDGRKTVFSYSGSKPSSVTLKKNDTVSEQKIDYTFNGDVVSSVAEYGVENSDFVLGTTTAYDYSVAANRTVVTITEAAEADEIPNTYKKVYAFDDDGNIISEYMYSAETGNVETSGDATGVNPISDSGYRRGSNNLLVDHNFCSLNSWSQLQTDDNTFAVEIVENSAESKFGKSFAKLSSLRDSSFDNGISQSVWLTAGEYTFSAYVRVISAVNASLFGAAIWVMDGSNQRISASERITVENSEYIRLVAPFKITNAQNIKVQIRFKGKGIVYVDGAQVEEGSCANEYDLLENGSFEKCDYSWDFNGANVSSNATFNRSRALVFYGDLEMAKKATQIIDVKEASSIRETFTLSAWAKANSLPFRVRKHCKDTIFRLCAEIKYKDEEITEEHTADFSPCTDEWQLVKLQFAKQKFKEVESVIVTCEYSYNSGTAYFDSVQLVRDSIEIGLSASDFVTETESYEDEEVPTTVSEETVPVFEESKDGYGNTTTETIFTDGEFGTIYRSFRYIREAEDGSANFDVGTTVGNDLIWESDARGNKTHYTVNEETSRNEEVTDRCGNKTAYEYDSMGRTTKVTSKNAAGEALANVSYTYDAFDNLSEIHRGDGMKYALAYDAFHNLESIGIEGKPEPLVKYGYKKGSGRLKSVTYANGNVMYATYNSLGQMVGEEWKDTADGNTVAQYRYSYDGNGNIVRSLDILNKREYTYTYEDGRIVRAAEAYVILQDNGFATLKEVESTILYTYNSEGQLTKKTIINAAGESTVIHIVNTEGNSVVKFKVDGRDITSHSKTDTLGRKLFDELQLSAGTLSRQFLYCKGETYAEYDEDYTIKSAATTQLVRQMILSNTNLGYDERIISYEYDEEERITKVIDSVDGTTEYTYDALGQLLTETVTKDGVTDVVNTMTYDNYGNILTKNGKVYTYGDSAWKDKLTAFDGQAITYDAQGNPLSYLGHTLTWEKGRQLKSFDGNSYTYNANGIRTSKTVDGKLHTYTLDGTKILRETWSEDNIPRVIVPMYDNEDSVCGIIYNNRPFYFIKNLQGDVIAITDAGADIVARYSYDAWGVPTIEQDTIIDAVYSNGTESFGYTFDIAEINPYRYRGYYYDSEIGCYYLQSRYYNPSIGRFLNVDEGAVATINKGMFQSNLFLYCNNNPISYWDLFGRNPIAIFIPWYLIAQILALLLALLAVCVVIAIVCDPNFQRALVNLFDEIGTGVKSLVDTLVKEINVALGKAKSKIRKNKYERHHIVAQKSNNDSAKKSRDLLYRANIGINSSHNLVDIKYNLHRSLHTNLYYDAVYNLLKKGKGAYWDTVVILGFIKSTLLVASAASP